MLVIDVIMKSPCYGYSKCGLSTAVDLFKIKLNATTRIYLNGVILCNMKEHGSRPSECTKGRFCISLFIGHCYLSVFVCAPVVSPHTISL